MMPSGDFRGNRAIHPERCTPGSLCSRCSLFEVIRVRFAAFRKQFGREPNRDEPLFFDPDKERPVAVDGEQAARQIEAAAAASGVNAEGLLKLFGLAVAPGEANGSGTRNFGRPIRKRRSRLAPGPEQVDGPIGRSAPYTGLVESGVRHPSQAVVAPNRRRSRGWRR
jgi:hypothetical protein